ncbi:uncharacterized protein LOC114541003 [Dendronephthya gigantea]|uniref:uncharacterized protein LOC114541003 n=1 Tax=Dendronephthya gigantea TaxID=151771 RepID=UPI00106CD7DB|nr:uncharacterized protein LOC114541003 [Dendronephthya gigantea]
MESSPATENTEDTAIWYRGENLMKLKVCEDEPYKYALKLLSKFFTPEELQDGILFKSRRSIKQPLDPAKVEIVFAVLNRKYGRKRVEESHTLIVKVCNQKCRNIRRVMKRLAKV